MADHVWLAAHGKPRPFRSKLKYIPPVIPSRPDRLKQAREVYTGFRDAFEAADEQVPLRTTRAALTAEPWSYLEVRAKDGTFSPDRYEIKSIEVVSVRKVDDENVAALLYVPAIQRSEYFKRVTSYRRKNDKDTGKPKYHSLIDSIDGLANADARALWTDDRPFPEGDGSHWWEVWIVSDRSAQVIAAANELGLDLSDPVSVLDRAIYVMSATAEQVERLVLNGNGLAELRAGAIPQFISRSEHDPTHRDHVAGLLSRVSVDESSPIYVSILDTGVNASHPLLAPILDEAHHLAIDNLSPLGTDPHGTNVAGLAGYGDLTIPLSDSQALRLTHRLESVNIAVTFPDAADVDAGRRFFARKVQQAIALAEFSDGSAKRVFCLALTMGRSSDGIPSTWSLVLDSAASEDGAQRLIVVSAGNIMDANRQCISTLPQARYIVENQASRVHDPAQAWNVLTVGGYTELTTLTPHGPHSGYTPLASSGDTSPYTSTSALWPRYMPIKPDIVCEAGNMAWYGTAHAQGSDDLEMLTTTHSGDGMKAFAQTSGAAALASRLAARVWARYPTYQPETIRGILVHSASWTAPMEARHGRNQNTRADGLRMYGYGVPNERLALESGDDSATIIIESRIQPYAKEGSTISGAEMLIHDLPWPTKILKAIHDRSVELRVTLSYFIEPLPGARSFRGRYSYQSHGLRFQVQRANEKKAQFIARISKVEEDEPDETVNGKDFWTYGKARNKGSIQSDHAIEAGLNIAQRNCIAVYPSGTGWWKGDQEQERYNTTARYALIVSLRPVGEGEVNIEGLYDAVLAASVKVPSGEIEIDYGGD